MSHLDTIIPPEICNDELYSLIYRICRDEYLSLVLEIGSSDGRGSTEAMVKGLEKNHGRPLLHCIEVSTKRHQALSDRYSNIPWMYCHNVSSVPSSAFPSEQQVTDFYNNLRTNLNHYPLDTVIGWLRQDLDYLEKEHRDIPGIIGIMREYRIRHFDLVLIDGSEFTGEAELELVYGAGFIILDDINAFKNYKNHIRLLNDAAYECIYCSRTLRNGFSAFRLKEKRLPVHFFTIVLNGMPFIRHHIEQFCQLPFRWHWHIVEGAEIGRAHV